MFRNIVMGSVLEKFEWIMFEGFFGYDIGLFLKEELGTFFIFFIVLYSCVGDEINNGLCSFWKFFRFFFLCRVKEGKGENCFFSLIYLYIIFFVCKFNIICKILVKILVKMIAIVCFLLL